MKQAMHSQWFLVNLDNYAEYNEHLKLFTEIGLKAILGMSDLNKKHSKTVTWIMF